MAQLQNEVAYRQQEQAQQQQFEAQKDLALNAALTPDAKARLTNLRLANPTLAEQVEQLVIYVFQQTHKKLSDAELRAVLEKIRGKKKEIKIIRK